MNVLALGFIIGIIASLFFGLFVLYRHNNTGVNLVKSLTFRVIFSFLLFGLAIFALFNKV